MLFSTDQCEQHGPSRYTALTVAPGGPDPGLSARGAQSAAPSQAGGDGSVNLQVGHMDCVVPLPAPIAAAAEGSSSARADDKMVA